MAYARCSEGGGAMPSASSAPSGELSGHLHLIECRGTGADCTAAEPLAGVGEGSAASDRLAMDDKGRPAETAGRLGGARDALDLAPPFPGGIAGKFGGGGAGFGQHRGDDGRILDVELALPETLEGC